MVEFQTRFQEVGHSCGVILLRLKPWFRYAFYLSMILYQCYDCVSDIMNLSDYYSSKSLDVSNRNDRVFHVFLVSVIVSCVCAVASFFGYVVLIVGYSKEIYKHERYRNDTFKNGKLIIFISLFCQVIFEETIQSVVIFYYIIRCSVVFSFWKTSLLLCTVVSLVIAGSTFMKSAYMWFKKEESLPRKYPSCLAPCYSLYASHVSCMVLCIFSGLLAFGLFILNAISVADVIKYSEVDIPHLIANNQYGNHTPLFVISIRKLVVSPDEDIIQRLPCARPKTKPRHFLDDKNSLNCTTAILSLSYAKPIKKVSYQLSYCFQNDSNCMSVKATNISLHYSHDLCSLDLPIFKYIGDPKHSVQTTLTGKPSQKPTNSSET